MKGKIVLCDGFRGPTSVGLVSGAAGILLRSSRSKDVAYTFALPAVHLGLNYGALIQSYINLTRYILLFLLLGSYIMHVIWES